MDGIDFGITSGLIILYFAWVNYLTYQEFAQDKVRSEKGELRIPEHALLSWTRRGGAPAAFYARKTLRHKTRKEPFSSQLKGIAIRQAFVVPVVLVTIFMLNPVGFIRDNHLIKGAFTAFSGAISMDFESAETLVSQHAPNLLRSAVSG